MTLANVGGNIGTNLPESPRKDRRTMCSSDQNPQDAYREEYRIPDVSDLTGGLPNETLMVELTGSMSFKLFGASNRRGQTPAEFVRGLIGEVCQNEVEPLPSGLDLPERGPAPGPGNMLDDLMPHMGKYLRLM